MVTALMRLFIHHHQTINIPTAGAQAFVIDYIKENGPSPTRQADCVWVDANDCKCSWDQLMWLPKHELVIIHIYHPSDV
jgi:hypothetical protein